MSNENDEIYDEEIKESVIDKSPPLKHSKKEQFKIIETDKEELQRHKKLKEEFIKRRHDYALKVTYPLIISIIFLIIVMVLRLHYYYWLCSVGLFLLFMVSIAVILSGATIRSLSYTFYFCPNCKKPLQGMDLDYTDEEIIPCPYCNTRIIKDRL